MPASPYLPSRGSTDPGRSPSCTDAFRPGRRETLAHALAGLTALLAGCATTPPPGPPAAAPPVPRPSLLLPHFGALPEALEPDAAARELVANALLLIGTPYRWGGGRPDEGFDCSGLVRHVFQESLHWRLPGTAREQFRVGHEIDRESLLPADLVFFSTRGPRASHVGLYIGQRRFVHAPNSRSSVRIEELRGSYWIPRFDGARRLIARA